jgi:hypothetical protein
MKPRNRWAMMLEDFLVGMAALAVVIYWLTP